MDVEELQNLRTLNFGDETVNMQATVTGFYKDPEVLEIVTSQGSAFLYPNSTVADVSGNFHRYKARIESLVGFVNATSAGVSAPNFAGRHRSMLGSRSPSPAPSPPPASSSTSASNFFASARRAWSKYVGAQVGSAPSDLPRPPPASGRADSFRPPPPAAFTRLSGSRTTRTSGF